jgi:hypothetical protein
MASWMDTEPMIEAREILTDLDTFNPSSPDVVGRVEVAKLARSLINVIEDQQRQIDELRGRLDRGALSPE